MLDSLEYSLQNTDVSSTWCKETVKGSSNSAGVILSGRITINNDGTISKNRC